MRCPRCQPGLPHHHRTTSELRLSETGCREERGAGDRGAYPTDAEEAASEVHGGLLWGGKNVKARELPREQEEKEEGCFAGLIAVVARMAIRARPHLARKEWQNFLHALWGNGTRAAATHLGEKDQNEFRERIITAIKQHTNHRGKQFGTDLPGLGS